MKQDQGGPRDAVSPARRRYQSPLREARAADTRRRIATAARELFTERGFTGTTVADIAGRAGVSVHTVYATFGSKGAIVRALLDQLEDDAGAAGWLTRIASETDPRRKLAAFAQWTTAMLSTSKTVIAAAQGTAADPAITDLKALGDRHRREALGKLVSAIAAHGSLRPDITRTQAVDRAWMLTGVELYLAATGPCGWSDAEYGQWITESLQDQLLAS
jgi:AcrR family transcriptional regulator